MPELGHVRPVGALLPPHHIRNVKASGLSRRRLCQSIFSSVGASGALMAVATVQPPEARAAKLFGGFGQQARNTAVPQSQIVDNQLAVAMINSVRDTLDELQVLSSEEFDDKYERFMAREYPYYSKVHKDELPGMSQPSVCYLENPVYFNFAIYAAWKLAAGEIRDPYKWQAMLNDYGKQLLPRVAPGMVQRLGDAKARNGQVPPEVIQSSLLEVLNTLQAGGYQQQFQLVWGAHPQLPYKWEDDQRQLVEVDFDSEDALLLQAPQENELFLQVRLRQPADLQGSVSLKEETNGLWGRTSSSLIYSLFNCAGYERSYVDTYFFQDAWQGPTSSFQKVLLALGDPLQTVEVPWVASSLIQDWTLEQGSMSTLSTPDTQLELLGTGQLLDG